MFVHLSIQNVSVNPALCKGKSEFDLESITTTEKIILSANLLVKWMAIRFPCPFGFYLFSIDY